MLFFKLSPHVTEFLIKINNQYTHTYIYDYYYKSLSGIIFSLILKNKMTATGISFFVLKDNLY